MKLSLRIFLTIALFMTVSFNANAQRAEKKPSNPEKKAQKRTTEMVEALQLDEAQTARVAAINLDHAKKIAAAKERKKAVNKAMKEAREAIHSEKDEQMKTILSENQYKSYLEMQTKKGNRKGEKGKKKDCLLYTSPSPRDATLSRMPSSA